MNPITQRTMTPTHANGAVPPSKPSTTKSNAMESQSHEKLAADRVAHLLSSLLVSCSIVPSPTLSLLTGMTWG